MLVQVAFMTAFLELLGPSAGGVPHERFCNKRLPGKLAKSIAKQTLGDLCNLHELGIALTILWPPKFCSCLIDLHIRNLTFTAPSMNGLHEEDFMYKLGTPKIRPVKRFVKFHWSLAPHGLLEYGLCGE